MAGSGAPPGAPSNRLLASAAGAVPGWLLTAVLGCALILPGLGAFGLWDPVELSLADTARDLARGAQQGVPQLDRWLSSLAFRVLGENALTARLPLASCGLCGVLLLYRVGRRLFGPRAGVAAAIVTLTAPAYLLQCRQLTSDAVYYLALTGSIGGLACYLWPLDHDQVARSRVDLVIGAIGLVAGFWARGLVLGALFPLLALGIAVVTAMATTRGRRPMKEALPGLAVALAGVAGAIYALWALFGGDPAATLLGGAWRPLAAPPTFEEPIRALGYGLFPWTALAPLALASFIGSDTGRLDRFGRHLVVVVVALGYLLAALWPAYVAPLRFPALPWLTLGVGAWAVEIFDRGEVRAHWGLVAAGLIAVLVVDVTLEPRTLVFSHLEASEASTRLVYPPELSIAREARPVGLGLAMLAFLSLSGPPRPIDFRCRTRLIGALLTRLSRGLDRAGRLLRALGGARQRRFHLAFVALALLCAGWTAHRLVPRLSEHLSDRELVETFRRCRGPDERLYRYQVPARGMAYHRSEPLPELHGQQQLLQMLATRVRLFVLVPATVLPQIEHATRKARIPYHVVDDRSSRVLLISNRLSETCPHDRNPLRRLVLQHPPKPSRLLAASFEKMVQLIGFDLDRTARRGGSLAITLYFRVVRPPPPGFKVFVHFDGPGGRIHGDHEPLEGQLPTQLWFPGDHLVDSHEIDLPLLTTAGGIYQVYIGFWNGPRRLRVLEGPDDGDNRVRLGTLQIR